MALFKHEKEILTRDDGMPIDFVPNGNRIVRVAPDSWRKMLNHRVRGYAGNDEELKSSDPDTVWVSNLYDDSVGHVADVSSFRKSPSRKPRAKVTEARQLTEAERFLPSAADILGDYNSQ